MEKKVFEEGKIKLFARMMSKSEMKDFTSRMTAKQSSEIAFAYEYVTEFDVTCYQKKYRKRLLREYITIHKGWTIQELADLVGVDRRTISRYLEELRGEGVEVITVRDTQALKMMRDWERLRDLIAGNPSQSRDELAKELGVSVSTVARLIKERSK